MAKMKSNKLGSWAFIIGVILALIAGLFGGASNAWVVLALVIIGLIIGFLNVTGKESMSFLMSSTALVIVLSLGGQTLNGVSLIGTYIAGVMNGAVALIVPATVVVALKAIWALAAD